MPQKQLDQINQIKMDALDQINRFLWRQWAQIGVAADVEFRDRWLIDPESLLLFTLQAARYDPRLFDEVVDWCVQNERYLSIQRLKNLSKQQPEYVARTLAALAQFLASQVKAKRWDSLKRLAQKQQNKTIHLFLRSDGTEFPLSESVDPIFAKYGILRPPLHTREMSRPVPVDSPANLIFKLRMLFGLGTRSDVIAYLLTSEAGNPSEIARAVSYAQPSVQEVLSELSSSGFVDMAESGRAKRISVDIQRWRQFLHLNGTNPVWVDWQGVFSALSVLIDFSAREQHQELSDYMQQSISRSFYADFAGSLANTRFRLRNLARGTQNDYVELFAQGAERLLSQLNGKPRP